MPATTIRLAQHIEPPPQATVLRTAKLLVLLAGWVWFRTHPAPGPRKAEGGFGDLLADLD